MRDTRSDYFNKYVKTGVRLAYSALVPQTTKEGEVIPRTPQACANASEVLDGDLHTPLHPPSQPCNPCLMDLRGRCAGLAPSRLCTLPRRAASCSVCTSELSAVVNAAHTHPPAFARQDCTPAVTVMGCYYAETQDDRGLPARRLSELPAACTSGGMTRISLVRRGQVQEGLGER